MATFAAPTRKLGTLRRRHYFWTPAPSAAYMPQGLRAGMRAAAERRSSGARRRGMACAGRFACADWLSTTTWPAPQRRVARCCRGACFRPGPAAAQQGSVEATALGVLNVAQPQVEEGCARLQVAAQEASAWKKRRCTPTPKSSPNRAVGVFPRDAATLREFLLAYSLATTGLDRMACT